MKRSVVVVLLLILLLTAVPGASAQGPGPSSCLGQATAVFAQVDEMGLHASQQPTPRLGLRNLARVLFQAGVIPDDSMASFGAFVADELGLSIEACMT